MIFGATEYTSAIDVWSIGCVFAELLLGHAIFAGETSVDQLVEIVKILGTPQRHQIEKMNPNYNEFKFPHIKHTSWNKVFKEDTPPEAIDLISKILVYDPERRVKPLEALLHPFFDEVREEATHAQGNLTDLFNFTQEEIMSTAPEIIEQLVPKWIQKS